MHIALPACEEPLISKGTYYAYFQLFTFILGFPWSSFACSQLKKTPYLSYYGPLCSSSVQPGCFSSFLFKVPLPTSPLCPDWSASGSCVTADLQPLLFFTWNVNFSNTSVYVWAGIRSEIFEWTMQTTHWKTLATTVETKNMEQMAVNGHARWSDVISLTR